MDLHFKQEIKNINTKKMCINIAENVSKNFKEMFEAVFN